MADTLTIPPIGNFSPTTAQPAPRGEAALIDKSITATVNPPNPDVHLDAALGIVVIQFSSEGGSVVSTIPSAQQLQAYRGGQLIDPSQPPPPVAATHVPATHVPAVSAIVV